MNKFDNKSCLSLVCNATHDVNETRSIVVLSLTFVCLLITIAGLLNIDLADLFRPWSFICPHLLLLIWSGRLINTSNLLIKRVCFSYKIATMGGREMRIVFVNQMRGKSSNFPFHFIPKIEDKHRDIVFLKSHTRIFEISPQDAPFCFTNNSFIFHSKIR